MNSSSIPDPHPHPRLQSVDALRRLPLDVALLSRAVQLAEKKNASQYASYCTILLD